MRSLGATVLSSREQEAARVGATKGHECAGAAARERQAGLQRYGSGMRRQDIDRYGQERHGTSNRGANPLPSRHRWRKGDKGDKRPKRCYAGGAACVWLVSSKFTPICRMWR